MGVHPALPDRPRRQCLGHGRQLGMHLRTLQRKLNKRPVRWWLAQALQWLCSGVEARADAVLFILNLLSFLLKMLRARSMATTFLRNHARTRSNNSTRRNPCRKAKFYDPLLQRTDQGAAS